MTYPWCGVNDDDDDNEVDDEVVAIQMIRNTMMMMMIWYYNNNSVVLLMLTLHIHIRYAPFGLSSGRAHEETCRDFRVLFW